jgi:hypothetical protein
MDVGWFRREGLVLDELHPGLRWLVQTHGDVLFSTGSPNDDLSRQVVSAAEEDPDLAWRLLDMKPEPSLETRVFGVQRDTYGVQRALIGIRPRNGWGRRAPGKPAGAGQMTVEEERALRRVQGRLRTRTKRGLDTLSGGYEPNLWRGYRLWRPKLSEDWMAKKQGSRAVDLDALISRARSQTPRRASSEPQSNVLLDRLLAEASRQAPRGEQGLLVISNGLGRDSATIITLLVQGKLVIDGRRVKPSDVDLVVFSDPGNEWEFSRGRAEREIGRLLDQAGVPHVALEKPDPKIWRPWLKAKRDYATRLMRQGIHQTDQWTSMIKRWGRENPQPWLNRDWQAEADREGIPVWRLKAREGGYHRRPPILEEREAIGWGTAMINHACTIGHKIDPFNELMNDLTLERWGVPLKVHARSKSPSYTKWVEEGRVQPHRVVIGLAADETKRIDRGATAGKLVPWRRSVYPLAQMGIRKQDETPILENMGLNFVKKSGCRICHFQPLGYFWSLRQTDPQAFAEVVAYQNRANARNPKWSIKNVIRVTTKRDAIPALVQHGVDATEAGAIRRRKGVAPQSPEGQRRMARLKKALNKDAALELLTEVAPQLRRPVLIEELVDEWRRENPDAQVDEVLMKTYERCGGMNRCPRCGAAQ